MDVYYGLKKSAIKLRRKGYSYSEILNSIPVAKSTLSLWLRSVGLSRRQYQRLTDKKRLVLLKGAKARKEKRLLETQEIMIRAASDVGNISERELMLMGTALYWAEGSKASLKYPSQGVAFSNSDPRMIKIFIKWLRDSLGIELVNIKIELYIHELKKLKTKYILEKWKKILNLNRNKVVKIYYKSGTKKIESVVNDNYLGQLRIKVRESTNLNRKISGWIEGIIKNCGVV